MTIALLDTEFKLSEGKHACINELSVLKYESKKKNFFLGTYYNYFQKDKCDLFQTLYNWLMEHEINTILTWSSNDLIVMKRAGKNSKYIKQILDTVVFYDFAKIYAQTTACKSFKLKTVFNNCHLKKGSLKFHRAFDDCSAMGMILNDFVHNYGIHRFEEMVTTGELGRQNKALRTKFNKSNKSTKSTSVQGSKINFAKFASVEQSKQIIPYANVIAKERSKAGLPYICKECGNKIRFQKNKFGNLSTIPISMREKFVKECHDLIFTELCNVCAKKVM